MKKLNLGCGMDYRDGWFNIDFNKKIKTDLCWDIEKKRLPFKDSSIDYVYCSHFLEHIKDLFKVLDDIWRVCKNGAIIEILVPHYTGTSASKFSFHYNYFGIDSFMHLTKEPNTSKERYGIARVNVLKQELRLFFGKGSNLKPREKYKAIHKISSCINIFNPLFNFSYVWQLFMEKLFVFGFEEIYYKLEVVKELNLSSNDKK